MVYFASMFGILFASVLCIVPNSLHCRLQFPFQLSPFIIWVRHESSQFRQPFIFDSTYCLQVFHSSMLWNKTKIMKNTKYQSDSDSSVRKMFSIISSKIQIEDVISHLLYLQLFVWKSDNHIWIKCCDFWMKTHSSTHSHELLRVWFSHSPICAAARDQ